MDSDISVSGRRLPISGESVRRAVSHVLDHEHRDANVSITFLGRDRMRDLNLRFKDRPRPTDVLAFSLREPDGALVGDVYVCPWVAKREAEARGLPLHEEILRLIVHGTLHVLGYDHPERERTESDMWQRQEEYVRHLTR